MTDTEKEESKRETAKDCLGFGIPAATLAVLALFARGFCVGGYCIYGGRNSFLAIFYLGLVIVSGILGFISVINGILAIIAVARGRADKRSLTIAIIGMILSTVPILLTIFLPEYIHPPIY